MIDKVDDASMAVRPELCRANNTTMISRGAGFQKSVIPTKVGIHL
jgi:hypothetical protein